MIEYWLLLIVLSSPACSDNYTLNQQLIRLVWIHLELKRYRTNFSFSKRFLFNHTITFRPTWREHLYFLTWIIQYNLGVAAGAPFFIVMYYFLRFLSRYVREFLFFCIFFFSAFTLDSKWVDALLFNKILELLNCLTVFLLSFDIPFLSFNKVFFIPFCIVSFWYKMLPFLFVVFLSVSTYNKRRSS